MRKHISLLLCFALALTVISPIAIEQSKTKNAQAASAPVEQVCELEDLRTKTSETYLLSDGTRECVVYAENKYYEDAQGKLERIDNSIIETKYSFNKKEYHYQNAANETAVYFAENEPAVLAVYGSNTLSYSLIGGTETNAAAGGSKKFGQVGDYSLCGNNYIAYHGVVEQTDLVFAVHNSGVKEYIVLGNDTAPSEFVFRFEHAGYSIKEVEYGRLGFFDEKGEMVFSLGSLYAVDAAGKYTDQVDYDLKEYNDTSAIIAIKLSESYMQDPERVYPILIDPSVAMTGADQTYDTFVSSKFPNTNYFEDNHLRTGYDDDLYVRRTYMRFIMPSYLYSTTYNITDARIKIRQYIGTTPQAKAYRVLGSWTSGSLTWNNKPSFTTTECSAQATLDNENWYNFVITTIIKKPLNGTYGDYGVMLKDDTESGTQHWSTFYSSEAASPNKPELHITYSGLPLSPENITIITPTTGYYFRYETLDSFVYVDGVNNNPATVKVYYPYVTDGGQVRELIEELSQVGSLWYYSGDETVSTWIPGYYSSPFGSWMTRGFYVTVTKGLSSVGKSTGGYITKNTRSYYSNIDSTFVYQSPTSNSFVGVGTPLSNSASSTYNCLSYAVGVYTSWEWPWDGNPTQSELDAYMTKTGAYTNRSGQAFVNCSIYYCDVIYYTDEQTWGEGIDGHFAKVVAWDASGIPTVICSKWGPGELIQSTDYNLFGGNTYGHPKRYYKQTN